VNYRLREQRVREHEEVIMWNECVNVYMKWLGLVKDDAQNRNQWRCLTSGNRPTLPQWAMRIWSSRNDALVTLNVMKKLFDEKIIYIYIVIIIIIHMQSVIMMVINPYLCQYHSPASL